MNLLKNIGKRLLDIFGRLEQEDARGLFHQRQDTDKDQDGNEYGTDRVGDLPAEVLD